MLRKIVTALILVPLALLIIAFAVANRQHVAISFDLFGLDIPAAPVTPSLSLAMITALILGVVIGGVTAWLGEGRWRRGVRRLEREVAALRAELVAHRPAAEPTIIPRQTNPPPRLRLKPPVS